MALYLPQHFIPRDERTTNKQTTDGHWSPPVCVLEAESEVQKNSLSRKKKKKTVSICPSPQFSHVTPSGRNKCISLMFCVGLLSVNDRLWVKHISQNSSKSQFLHRAQRHTSPALVPQGNLSCFLKNPQ